MICKNMSEHVSVYFWLMMEINSEFEIFKEFSLRTEYIKKKKQKNVIHLRATWRNCYAKCRNTNKSNHSLRNEKEIIILKICWWVGYKCKGDWCGKCVNVDNSKELTAVNIRMYNKTRRTQIEIRRYW